MTAVTRLRSINLALCRRIHWRLPAAFREHLAPVYQQMVLYLAQRLESGTIMDIGAGFIAPVSGATGLPSGIDVIGLDLSHEALANNLDVDYRLAADACKPWPVADASIDIVISRSVIEHLQDTETFARECHRVLKPGGYSVHLLPGRNAPFSLLNRLLPNSIANRLLLWAFPDKIDELGFPAYYQNCSYPKLVRLFEDNGLELELSRLRYYQASISTMIPGSTSRTTNLQSSWMIR